MEAIHPSPGHQEEHHPSTRFYVGVGALLFIITAIEVALYYVPDNPGWIPPVLFALSAVKFATVAAWFMHLRYDTKLFTVFLTSGIILAASIVVAVIALVGGFGPGSVPPPGSAQHAAASGHSAAPGASH